MQQRKKNVIIYGLQYKIIPLQIKGDKDEIKNIKGNMIKT